MSQAIGRWRTDLVEQLQVYRWPQPLRRLAISKLIPRQSATDFPFTVDLRGMVYRGNASNFIDYKVLTDGEFEPGLVALMIRIAHEQGGQVGGFVDIGANVGHHSLILSAHFQNVVAVEPYPPAFDQLAARLRENGVRNVEPIKIGFSDRAGLVAFKPPPPANLGLGSINHAGGLCIETCRGDDLLLDWEPRIVLVKIDVEGHELAVLSGLAETLETQRPFVIVEVMVMDTEQRRSLPALLPRDYVFSRIDRHRSGAYRLPVWSGELADEVLCWPAESGFAAAT